MGRVLDRLVRLIYTVSVLVIAGAVAYGVVILNSRLEWENNVLGKVSLVPGSKPLEPVPGLLGTAQDPSSTVWESTCPEGTKVISGTCISQSGPFSLQNIGPNEAANRWECVWAGSVPKADVQAICLKQEPSSKPPPRPQSTN
jgi:hypothetical protein